MSVFTDNLDIWGWVYGIPTVIGLLLLTFCSGAGFTFGALLIFGVVGSFVVISVIEAVSAFFGRR